MHILWIFFKKGRNCDANLLKKWPFENLWNHFEVLLNKVSPEFMIFAFHDFKDAKMTKCGYPLFFLSDWLAFHNWNDFYMHKYYNGKLTSKVDISITHYLSSYLIKFHNLAFFQLSLDTGDRVGQLSSLEGLWSSSVKIWYF